MNSAFVIKDHLVESQHIREYPNATANSQEEVLHLTVRQYTPKSNQNPQKGDITIIGAHANGFVKEMYEPLWHDLLQQLEKRGTRVRSIWMADCAWQGQSGVVNESKLGNDPSWIDHARDLLAMINQFRREMPQPIVGVGHSFGGAVLVNLSLIHPRLLHHLILLDPVIVRTNQETRKMGPMPLVLSSRRRDFWPNREEAKKGFKKSKFYQSWDPRVLDAFLSEGLRDTPTSLYPEPGHVTLTTTKHQEVFTYMRPLAQGIDASGNHVIDDDKILDADPVRKAAYPQAPLYRAESASTGDKLPYVRPSVLYVHGGTSDISIPPIIKAHLENTGSGLGGSGGAKAGRVAAVTFEKHGHLVPFEVPDECANVAAESIVQQVKRWHRDEADFQAWAAKPTSQKQTIDVYLQELVKKLAPPRQKL